jgi:hypothetical protein
VYVCALTMVLILGGGEDSLMLWHFWRLVGEPREAKGEARALRLSGESIKVAGDGVTLL